MGPKSGNFKKSRDAALNDVKSPSELALTELVCVIARAAAREAICGDQIDFADLTSNIKNSDEVPNNGN